MTEHDKLLELLAVHRRGRESAVTTLRRLLEERASALAQVIVPERRS